MHLTSESMTAGLGVAYPLYLDLTDEPRKYWLRVHNAEVLTEDTVYVGVYQDEIDGANGRLCYLDLKGSKTSFMASSGHSYYIAINPKVGTTGKPLDIDLKFDIVADGDQNLSYQEPQSVEVPNISDPPVLITIDAL